MANKLKKKIKKELYLKPTDDDCKKNDCKKNLWQEDCFVEAASGGLPVVLLVAHSNYSNTNSPSSTILSIEFFSIFSCQRTKPDLLPLLFEGIYQFQHLEPVSSHIQYKLVVFDLYHIKPGG